MKVGDKLSLRNVEITEGLDFWKQYVVSKILTINDQSFICLEKEMGFYPDYLFQHHYG